MMKTRVIAACMLALATAPVLAAGNSGAADSSNGQASDALSQKANSAQQSGGMKDKMKKKAGEQGKRQIDKHAGTGQSGNAQDGNSSAAGQSSGGMKDKMKKKAGDQGKRQIDKHAGTGSGQ